MKTYELEVQRLKSAKHDMGMIELGIDVLVAPRAARDDQPATKWPGLSRMARISCMAAVFWAGFRKADALAGVAAWGKRDHPFPLPLGEGLRLAERSGRLQPKG